VRFDPLLGVLDKATTKDGTVKKDQRKKRVHWRRKKSKAGEEKK